MQTERLLQKVFYILNKDTKAVITRHVENLKNLDADGKIDFNLI